MAFSKEYFEQQRQAQQSETDEKLKKTFDAIFAVIRNNKANIDIVEPISTKAYELLLGFAGSQGGESFGNPNVEFWFEIETGGICSGRVEVLSDGRLKLVDKTPYMQWNSKIRKFTWQLLTNSYRFGINLELQPRFLRKPILKYEVFGMKDKDYSTYGYAGGFDSFDAVAKAVALSRSWDSK